LPYFRPITLFLPIRILHDPTIDDVISTSVSMIADDAPHLAIRFTDEQVNYMIWTEQICPHMSGNDRCFK
jgi:hypothetical protein